MRACKYVVEHDFHLGSGRTCTDLGMGHSGQCLCMRMLWRRGSVIAEVRGVNRKVEGEKRTAQCVQSSIQAVDAQEHER